MRKLQIQEGLRPTPKDLRDFSLGGVFGQMDVKLVPDEDFVVAEPLKIKNQKKTDMCTAFSLCAVSEDQEKVILDENFCFAKIKEQRGEYKGWGADLRSGCKVAKRIGFIPWSDTPFMWEGLGRNFVANWHNWKKFPKLLLKALKHKKESFFKVDGRYDLFDNLRVALWQNIAERRSIYTGCAWQKGWTYCKGGIIPKRITNSGIGHAVKIFGQKMINGEPYLMLQNSFGTQVGDKGIFYVPRNIINTYFNYGAYMFKDMPPEIAKDLDEQAKNNKSFVPPNESSIWERFWRWLNESK